MTDEKKDFRKLIDDMPANLTELARTAHVSERSVMRMRDGHAVLRGTANKILLGLSQIYHEKLTLENVTGITLFDKQAESHTPTESDAEH